MQHVEAEHHLEMFAMANRKAHIASANGGQNLWAARRRCRSDRFDNGVSKQFIALDGKFSEESGLVLEVVRRRPIRDPDLASNLSKRELAHADFAYRVLRRSQGCGAKVAVVVGSASLARLSNGVIRL